VSGDWSYWLREHKGTLLAFAAFVVMFAIYAANHPVGLNANVATTAANKGVLLAIVAIAQTLVVLTSGIDLSVGMVMVLANCLASGIVVGSSLMTALGVLGVLLVGCLCGAINGLIVIYGRLQPIVTTIATGSVYYGVALALRRVPGGDVNAQLADALTGQLPGGVPASLAVLLALVLIVWLPRGLRGWLVRGRGLHVGRADPTRQIRRLYAVGTARVGGGVVSYVHHLLGRGISRQRQYLHAVFDRCGRAGRSVAVRRFGQRDRSDLRRADVPHHRRPAFRVQRRTVVATAIPGHGAVGSRLPRLGPAAARP
jgi:hypothetical protein